MSDPLKPYADLYVNPNGPGDQRPTAQRVIESENAFGRLAGKVVLLTGGTSGIGLETATALHTIGADVFITARDREKAEMSIQHIKGLSSGSGKLEWVDMDLDSLGSVHAAAEDFLSRSDKLNILINNAGIMACPESKTLDGFERQLGVNHLAHYLLTKLLLPTLIASSTANNHSRILNISSTGHRASKFLWDNYNFEVPGSYDPMLAYGQSKTANIWTANYIERHFGSRGVHAWSVHPGGVWSGLQRFIAPEMLQFFKDDPTYKSIMQTAEQGAASPVWAAVATVLEGKGGKYISECGVADVVGTAEFQPLPDAAPWAYEPESEDQLWELSERLVKNRGL